MTDKLAENVALKFHMKNKGDKTHKEAMSGIAERVAVRTLDRQIAERVAQRYTLAAKKPAADKEPAPLPEALLKLVAADAPKAKERAAEITKLYESIKKLQDGAENEKPAAMKKFDEAYKKLYSMGEAAAKAGDALIEKLRPYENHIVDDSQAAHALHLLHAALGDWKRNRVDHLKVKEQFGYRFRAMQAEQTWAYGKLIDDRMIVLDQAVRGEFD